MMIYCHRFIDKEDSDAEPAPLPSAGEDNVFFVEKRAVASESPARDVKRTIAKESPKSDMDMSVVSNDSIEIELKDPHSSFSSYDSGEDGEGRPSFLLDDMDMTKCVGGIIGGVGGESTGEDATMDLTSCIGGILNNIPNYGRVSPSSVDTMELTSVVGGILRPKDAGSGVLGGLASTDPTQMANNADDMDMTVVIKDTIKTTSRMVPPASPSPFLVSPRRLNSPLQSEVSFIGDVDQPGNLGFTASPAPARTEMVNAPDDMDLTTELFNKYSSPSSDDKLMFVVDTSRFNALTMHPNEERIQSQSSQGQQPSTLHNYSQLSNVLASPLANMTLATSQTESPTVTLILPRASLKEFLNETGVRFLDNLSSLNRRETTGRPRESEAVSCAKQLSVDGGLSLESDALDAACGRLATMIGELRDDLLKQEEQFNHSPPLAFLQYRDPQERSTVVSKLKTLKSIARLYAKQAWYEWRNPIHTGLNQSIEKNLTVLTQRVSLLSSMSAELDLIISKLNPLVEEITNEAEVMRERCDAMANDDIEQAQQMEQLVANQKEQLTSLDEEMSILVKHEEELRASIDRTLAKRNELQQKVTTIKQQIDSIPETSPIVLEELRSSFKLLQGVTGWRLLRITASDIIFHYSRADLGVAFKLGLDSSGNSSVMSVSFDVSLVVLSGNHIIVD